MLRNLAHGIGNNLVETKNLVMAAITTPDITINTMETEQEKHEIDNRFISDIYENRTVYLWRRIRDDFHDREYLRGKEKMDFPR